MHPLVHPLVHPLAHALARLGLSVVVVILGLGCGGAAEVGEACTERGSAKECVDGAVCDSVEGKGDVCLKLCDDDADCGADEACNGISGASGKACQPKSK